VVQAKDTEHEEQTGGMGKRVQTAGGDGSQAVECLQVASGVQECVRERLIHQPQTAGGEPVMPEKTLVAKIPQI
jgi:hypothetical protein